MKPLLTVTEDHCFIAGDLVGGEPVLDFVNTVTGRGVAPRDWLARYDDLVCWAELAGVGDEALHSHLRARAQDDVSASARALADARKLREDVFHILYTILKEDHPAPAQITGLHRRWTRAAARQTFVFHERRLVNVPAARPPLLGAIADWLVLDAVRLLSGSRLIHLRICEGPNCAWLFVDTSKAHRRRWCSMATCGSAEKYRRHQRRG